MSEKIHLYIDGELILSERDFHNFVSKLLDFGPYYGNNLDALWDRLSSGIGKNIVLHWKNSALSRTKLGAKFNIIVQLFEEARNEDIQLGLKEPLLLILE
jgi:ribonuclease inhibitor